MLGNNRWLVFLDHMTALSDYDHSELTLHLGNRKFFIHALSPC
jgi:hypothetical protein